MRVLVMLPTYNEIENIQDVLERARAALPDADILVIDDGSPDGTAEQAEKVGEVLGGVDVLRRASKSGLGSAYRAGFRVGLARGYDVMIEMDADLSHDPAELPVLVAAVEAGADLYARTMLGLSVQDSTAGFRAYHRRNLSRIDLDRVRADGYGFQVEMTYLTERNGGRITEVPIEFRDRSLGRSKMSSRIVVEAFLLVTWWGVRDRVRRVLRARH